MATRKTYENRTQVDIPFSSVPIVSPTVTAGRGAVVGPAQVQPSKLVSLSNALGIATQATSTLTNIAELQKQQGLRAGKLAAESEAEASLNAVNELEQRLISKGQLVESQSLAFRTGYNEIMGSRIGDEYGNKLRARINEAITNDLSKDVDPEVYIKSIVDNEYQTYNEQLKNNPIALASFNKVARYKNNEFYSSTLKARNDNIVAVRNKEAINHATSSLISATSETMGEAVNVFSNLHPDKIKNEELQLKTLENGIRSLMGGEPSIEKNERIKDLLKLFEITKGAKGANSLSVISPSKYFTLSSAQSQYEANLKQKTEIDSKDALANIRAIPNLVQMAIDDPEYRETLEEHIAKIGGNKDFIDDLLVSYIDKNQINIEDIYKKVLPNTPAFDKAYTILLGDQFFDLSFESFRMGLAENEKEDLGKKLYNQGVRGDKIDIASPLFELSLDSDNVTSSDRKYLMDQYAEGVRFSYGTTKDRKNNQSAVFFSKRIEGKEKSATNSAIEALKNLDAYITATENEQNLMEARVAEEFSDESAPIIAALKNSLDESIQEQVNIYFDQNGKLPEGNDLLKIHKNAFGGLTDRANKNFEDLTENIFKRLPFIAGLQTTGKDVVKESLEFTRQFEPLDIYGRGKKSLTQLSRRDQLITINIGYAKLPEGANNVKNNLGYMSISHIPKEDLKSINPYEIPLFDNSIIKGTSWDYDNENPNIYNILRETEKEFDRLEEEYIDPAELSEDSRFPQVKWFYENLRIGSSEEFNQFLTAQKSLTEVYDRGEKTRNTKHIIENSLLNQYNERKIQPFKDAIDQVKFYIQPIGGSDWYSKGQKGKLQLPTRDELIKEQVKSIQRRSSKTSQSPLDFEF